MRICVLGCGSIGLRHARNLLAVGEGDVTGYDPDPARRETIREELGMECCATLNEVWDRSPEAAFITAPTSLHVELALAAAEHGCNLFIEKPLSHTSEGLAELQAVVAERGLITMIGCNMRFHPGPAGVKSLLDQGRIGKVLFARLHTGSYLPSWRPSQDYRQSYSASRALGGGCLLDCVHEIDLARWYLGDVEEVACMASRLSSLELDVEDVAALICRHRGGALSEIHLDYVQRTYERGCQIVGEDGSVFWDFASGAIRWFDAASGLWECLPHPDGNPLDRMYLDEIRHFLSCVRGRIPPALTICEGVRVMEIVFAARRSAEARCFIPTAGFSL